MKYPSPDIFNLTEKSFAKYKYVPHMKVCIKKKLVKRRKSQPYTFSIENSSPSYANVLIQSSGLIQFHGSGRQEPDEWPYNTRLPQAERWAMQAIREAELDRKYRDTFPEDEKWDI